MKEHHAATLHLAFRVYLIFKQRHGFVPAAGNRVHAQLFYELCVSINEEAALENHYVLDNLADSENLLKRFALSCSGHISPMCAYTGGILGQEVLKACSGKFGPIQQWFYCDAVECLSDEPLSYEEVCPVGNKYDGQVRCQVMECGMYSMWYVQYVVRIHT